MKQLLLSALFSASAITAFCQTMYNLEVIAEGNFGTPNGDVFLRTTVGSSGNSTGMYQLANSSTGFDVLQDYKIAGNKAVFLTKGLNYSIVIANYPSFTHVETFTGVGAPQSAVTVSPAKVYVSVSNSDAIHCINLANNTLSTVTDANSAIDSYSDHMVAAGGFVYAQIAGDIVKIDTVTNAVVGTIAPAVGSISGLVADASQQTIWVMGALNGTATLKAITVSNDQVGPAITLTGVTAGENVRYYNGQVYFWSGKNLHRYNIATPNIPTSSVYLSLLPGDNWSFGYGRAFDIDEVTGDFVIGSANNYSAPSYFEVVDGTTFTLIESETMPGCAIVNNFVLQTIHDVTGIEEQLNDLKAIAYPNPANAMVTVKFEHDGQSADLVVTDLVGNRVQTIENASETTMLNVESLPAGVYFIRVQTTTRNTSCMKIAVEH